MDVPVSQTTKIEAVGGNVRRIDGVEKVTGKALYAGDLRLPGMKQRRGATLGAPRNFWLIIFRLINMFCR
ncbi:MAG: hypothetical protein DME76_04115 [Verrucomicrobia bacterium]|nr:MAG: hypothetical protein DME76_04115 [Verrucomicrobiota bacterium]